MSDTYQPIIGSDEEYELAPTSTKNMEALDRLKMRAPCAGEQERGRVAINYGYGTEEESDIEAAFEGFGLEKPDDVLSPPRFWEEVAAVIFEDLAAEDTSEGVDFAEVRLAHMDFTTQGTAGWNELVRGLNGSGDSSRIQDLLETFQTQ